MLVGCGGTGSFLALDMARLAWHAKARGIAVNLTFVDFDRVEYKNIGRQNFAPVEIGRYKSETLAERYSCAFGLAIRHITAPFQGEMIARDGWRKTRAFKLIVGAVDNAGARRQIDEAIRDHYQTVWWLDSGNLHAAGQIILGNRVNGWEEKRAFPGTGFCHSLPAPSLLRPGLLTPKPKPTGLSCAELTLNDTQSLMVNKTMAAFAAQYLYQIVITRDLKHFMTLINLDDVSAYTYGITPKNIARELGLD